MGGLTDWLDRVSLVTNKLPLFCLNASTYNTTALVFLLLNFSRTEEEYEAKTEVEEII